MLPNTDLLTTSMLGETWNTVALPQNPCRVQTFSPLCFVALTKRKKKRAQRLCMFWFQIQNQSVLCVISLLITLVSSWAKWRKWCNFGAFPALEVACVQPPKPTPPTPGYMVWQWCWSQAWQDGGSGSFRSKLGAPKPSSLPCLKTGRGIYFRAPCSQT